MYHIYMFNVTNYCVRDIFRVIYYLISKRLHLWIENTQLLYYAKLSLGVRIRSMCFSRILVFDHKKCDTCLYQNEGVSVAVVTF